MAFDAFLKLDEPALKGEATDDAHKEEIVLESFAFGVAQTGTGVGTSGGHAGGRASFSNLSVSKSLDAASPNLYLHCALGTVFKKGLMTVRRAGGESPLEYLKVELSDVMITNVDASGSTGSTLPMETVGLAFGSMKWTYTQQDPSTGGAKGDVAAGYDLKIQKKI